MLIIYREIIIPLLLLISIKASAQYPFEKYPDIRYHKSAFKIVHNNKNNTNSAVAKFDDYRVELLEHSLKNGNNILLYFKNTLIKGIVSDFYTTLSIDEPLHIGDINGDGLFDLKIAFANAAGSGLAGSRVWKLYLFNKGNNKFDQIYIGDFYDGKKEYDFDGDGNFEIIGQSYVSYKWHAYWLFDLYNYKDGKLINVSNQFNYPVMVRFLASKESYAVTRILSRLKMKTFSQYLPEFYRMNNN